VSFSVFPSRHRIIIKEFFTRVDDLTLSIPYLMPIIIDRLNADDLEGIDSLPE
jgi:hypothetical protein